MPTYLKAAKEDGDKKRKAKKIKGDKPTTTQYGLYSGIVTEEGKTIRNPKESEAITNMVKYMKNNRPPQMDRDQSNIYRPQFSHLTIAYDRKKKQKDA